MLLQLREQAGIKKLYLPNAHSPGVGNPWVVAADLDQHFSVDNRPEVAALLRPEGAALAVPHQLRQD